MALMYAILVLRQTMQILVVDDYDNADDDYDD